VTSWHRERVQERAYAIWEAEGRRHGHDLAHWFQPEREIPLRVTFDSNAYRQAVNPCSARDASPFDLQKINDAVKTGRVRGYLSETLVTLEGIENKAFTRRLAPLKRKNWFVYAKPPFAGPEAVLAYLARYTHRVAIANSRLVGLDQRGVTFRYKDYRRNGPERFQFSLQMGVTPVIISGLLQGLPKCL
jgi:hypothetical protein